MPVASIATDRPAKLDRVRAILDERKARALVLTTGESLAWLLDGARVTIGNSGVTLPLMVPALATTAIFTFIWTWGDFFGPLIYLRTRENFPVSIALKGFIDAQSTSNYGAMFAVSVVSLLPLFFAFLLGQKYLVEGIATTGIK